VRFGKSDKIQFISTVEGLESIEECLPRPAKNFIPQWFKDIPLKENFMSTVKICPSFPDFFSQGYIIPMWSDVKLKFDKENQSWEWKTPINNFNWDIHPPDQLLSHTKVGFNGIDSQFVFKAGSPWKIITPPGWSVLQLPLFYHFNKEWSVMPGIIDTDIHSAVNQQVLYHGDGKEITINRGDPFVLYIPFERSKKLKHEIKYQTEKDKRIFNGELINLNGKFDPIGIYRKKQRERDKNF
jgi:hypothetical protein